MKITNQYCKIKQKDDRYLKKQQERAIQNLSQKELEELRATALQLYCTTALQISLIDKMDNIGLVTSKYDFIRKFLKNIEHLNTELYKASVTTEERDNVRREEEDRMENIIISISNLSLKQLEKLENYINNIKYEK